MAFRFHRLFLVWILALAIGSAVDAARVLPSAAPSPQPTPKPDAAEQFLTPHNQARAAVGVGALSWSPALASGASRYARYQRDRKGCGFADLGASPYGANQAWASYPAGPAEVVASWVEGRQYYDRASNTCAAGHECGTYTQVVWRRTAEVGCAQATCAKGATLTVCLYNPHGNVQGERPY